MNKKRSATHKRGELLARKRRGFSLIELMVVIVIVGILASIAFPSYVNQVTATKRSDGQITLLNNAQALERCFTEFNSYLNANCTFDATTPNGHYAITVARAATTFTFTATPNASQTDPLCANLTLSNTGVQGISGSGTVAECW